MSALPDLDTVAELLKQLLAMSQCLQLSTTRSKRVSRRVRQWTRSLGAAEMAQRLTMDPLAAHVKVIFGLLQSVQVMHPRLMGPCACCLRWDDSNCPEIVRSSWSPLVGPDIHSIRHAETKLFEKLYVKWDQPTKGQYSLTVAATGDDIVDILIALSGGRSFLSEPDGFDSLSEIVWLRNLSQFTFGQYIAGALELALWRAFTRRNEPLTRPAPTAACSCIHQLLVHETTSINSAVSLVYQEGLVALRELMTCDSGLLSFFVTIMKPRVKRAEDSPTCSFLSAKEQDYLRIWAAASAAGSWLRSVQLLKQRLELFGLDGRAAPEDWRGTVLDCFLNIPFFEMNSFTLEHKLRTKDRLWNKGTMLISEMLIHPTSLQTGVLITATTTTKLKSKKKPKSRQRQQHSGVLTSSSGAMPRSNASSASEKSTTGEVMIALARGSVPAHVVERTQIGIFVSRIIDGIIDAALDNSNLHSSLRAVEVKRRSNRVSDNRKRRPKQHVAERVEKGPPRDMHLDQLSEWPNLRKIKNCEDVSDVSGSVKPSNSQTSVKIVKPEATAIVGLRTITSTSADEAIIDSQAQLLRGRVLGSWSFGLDGNLSNDADLSSSFFYAHRNDFNWNPLRLKKEADRKHVHGGGFGDGKRDSIQKVLDDDDFWVAGRIDRDEESDPEGMLSSFSKVRPWDRRTERVLLSRLNDDHATRAPVQDNPPIGPLYAVLSQEDIDSEVEACLDLRNISYAGDIPSDGENQVALDENMIGMDNFSDLGSHNIIILSPDSRESPAVAMVEESVVPTFSALSPKQEGLDTTTVNSTDSGGECEDNSRDIPFAGNDTVQLSMPMHSSSEGRASSSTQSSRGIEHDEETTSLSFELAECAGNMHVLTRSNDDADDHWAEGGNMNPQEEAQPLIERRATRTESNSNFEAMTEKLKKTILGFEKSGRAISAALDRHREVPKADSQRRKSGDWQQLQLVTGSGFYTSPGGRRFGRDDSDTRHYRRLIILNTRTPATSPTLELGKKTGDMSELDLSRQFSLSEDSIISDALSPDRSAEHQIDKIEVTPRELGTVLETRVDDMDSQEEEESVIADDQSSEDSDFDVHRSLSTSADGISEITDMEDHHLKLSPIVRSRGVSDPPSRSFTNEHWSQTKSGRIRTCTLDGESGDHSVLFAISTRPEGAPATESSRGTKDLNAMYLLASLALMRSQFEASVLANILAVQRSLIEYFGSTAATLQRLGPQSFHPGGPHFNSQADIHFASVPPYENFVTMPDAAERSTYKTTEDISSVSYSSRAFPLTPPSLGMRPPLPKAPAPSTLLHTLHQDSSLSRLNDSDFDRCSLQRRHSLSGADPIDMNIAAAHHLSPISVDAIKQRASLRSKDKDKPTNSADEVSTTNIMSREKVKTQRNTAECTVYNNIYKLGEYDGMGSAAQSPLTREIRHFVSVLDSYSDSVYRSKMEVLRRIRSCVSNLWPRAQAKPFGSFVTGISLPRSDIDVVICLPKVRKEAEPNAPGVLEGRNAIKETWQQKLTQGLMREGWVDNASIRIIPNTAVPVLKFLTKPIMCENGNSVVFSLDVSFEGPGHRGLEANKLVMSVIRRYPALRSIVLVLKCFLSRKGLCEAFTGGLSSYVLVLMVARFLQEQSSVKDIGALLLGVLDFYGNRLDPRATGISFARACYFSRDMNFVSGAASHPAPPHASVAGVASRRQPFIRATPLHTANLSSHSLGESYNTPRPIRIDTPSGFSSAPISPAESVCGDSIPLNAPYFGVSYSEDYIGYVHSTPGEYSHHPGGSVMLSAGSAALSSSQHPDSGQTLGIQAVNMGGNSSNNQHQPPLFYKFDPFFVEDPLSRGNNVGRNCFRIYQVQRCWSEALSSISIQTQRLEDIYSEYCEYNGKQGMPQAAAYSDPVLLDMDPLELSLIKCLVGDTTSYRPW